MSKDTQDWSVIYERNIEQSLKTIDEYDFTSLQLPPEIDHFVLELSSNHKCDPKVLFYSLLSVIGHYAEAITVYNLETKQSKPTTVYEVLIAPSGVEKSKYINVISNACTTFEMYLYEYCYRKERNFGEPLIAKSNVQNDEKKKKNIKSYEHWINDHGSIKQVYTTPSLLQMMTGSNLYFLANEGDAILQECSFYNPSDVTSDVKQGTLIDCWDGNKIVKSTITHGTQEIKNRTVSMCIATTGRRWPDLLRELSKVQIAGGLHERCTFFCFDVHGDADIDYITKSNEQQFFGNLYDDLLCTATHNEQSKYSLVHILCVVKLFGYRSLIWSREAFAFLQPRLNELKANKPCSLIQNPNLFKTKQHMAIRRRSAEHTVRYACLIQMFLNAMHILKTIDENTIKFGTINEEFETRAKDKIDEIFGPTLERQKSFHQNGVPIQTLQVGLQAATSAVALVFSLLLPQAILLFNYEIDHEDKMNEDTAFDERKPKMTKQQQHAMKIEKFILSLDYCFFHKTCITDRYFRDKRTLVDKVLNDLVERQLLYCGHGDTLFFETRRASVVKTYLKFVPSVDDQQRFRDSLLLSYGIQYEDYIAQFDHASLLPLNCHLKPYGRNFIRQAQYASIMIKKELQDSNKSSEGVHAVHKQALSSQQDCISVIDKPFLSGADENDYNECEKLAYNADDIIQHTTNICTNPFIQSEKPMNYGSIISKDDTKDVDDLKGHNLLLSTTVVSPKKTVSPIIDDIIHKQNGSSLSLEHAPQNESIVTDDGDEKTLGEFDTHLFYEKLDNVFLPINESDRDISTENSQPDEIESNAELSHTQTNAQFDEALKTIENDQGKTGTKTMVTRDNKFAGKILLIPSIVLTKGLITSYVKATASEINDALEYLLQEKLLTKDKYLQSGKRPVDAYLKHLPENTENKINKYLLQRHLLDFQVNVDLYIDSLKGIKYASTSQRPAKMLVDALQAESYNQLHIDLSTKRKETDKDIECLNYEQFIHDDIAKQMKTNDETE